MLTDITQDFSQFQISIDDADDPNPLTKSLFLNRINRFYKMLVWQDCNSMPEAEIYIQAERPSDILNIKNITTTITLNTGTVLKLDLGVRSVEFNRELIAVYKCYMCKYEDIHEIGSEYLGADLQSALTKLNVKLLDTGTKMPDKITKDYFRIQESRLDSFLRLLKSAKKNSIYVIDTSKVSLIDMSTLIDAPPIIPPLIATQPDSIIGFSKNRNIHDASIPPMSLSNEFNYDDSDSGLSIYTNYGKFFIEETSANTAILNQETSYPYKKFQTDTILRVRYNNRILPEVKVGDMFRTDYDNTIEGSFIVLGKAYKFSRDGYRVNLTLGNSDVLKKATTL